MKKHSIIITTILSRQIFCDFGENFAISDVTGEQPISVIISAVTKETKSVVTCSDETRHNFQSGDYVTFTEVQVCSEICKISCLLYLCAHSDCRMT